MIEDFGGIPQFKESIHSVPGMATNTLANVKIDSSSSLNNVIDFNIDQKDNAFSKNTFNLNPIAANSASDDFNDQMDLFDEGLSELIIENNENLKKMEQAEIEMNILPSANIPYAPIIFTDRKKRVVESAIVFDKSLIKK